MTSDGGIDFFLGVYKPTGNGRIGIYNSDPNETKDAPSNTGISKSPITEYVPVDGDNYSIMEVDDGSTFTGDTDYFVTFKVPVADINAALQSVSKDITITESTHLRYIIGTAAQDNAFNQDIGGIEGLDFRLLFLIAFSPFVIDQSSPELLHCTRGLPGTTNNGVLVRAERHNGAFERGELFEEEAVPLEHVCLCGLYVSAVVLR